MRVLGRLVAALLGAGLLAGLALVGLLTAYTQPGPAATPTRVVIESATTVQGIAAQLERNGVVADRRILHWGWRLFDGGSALQAGEYRFAAGVSPAEAAAKLAQGDTVVHRLTVPGGLTSKAIVERLRAEPALTGDITQMPPEGRLLPDTYHFDRGDRRQQLLARMRRAMMAYLDRAMPDRLTDLPLDGRDEVLTLASIVEREAANRAEQPLVAGVFMNRLRSGMRLQADATVIYALTQGQKRLGRALTRADWRVESPYNTYRHAGLPPGPIAHPSRSSIQAVIHPAETDYRYFVAASNGRHLFARTLEEHNRNIQRLESGQAAIPHAPPPISP